MADRKISDLTALTTPATGDLIPIVDISEAAAADKNKSITVGELLRGAPDGTAAAPGIAFESDGGNGMFLGGTDILAFSTGGTQAVTIDASQRVGLGTSSFTPKLAVYNGVDGTYADPNTFYAASENTGSYGLLTINSDSLTENKAQAGVVGVGRVISSGTPGASNEVYGVLGIASNGYGGGVNAFGVGCIGNGYFSGSVGIGTTSPGGKLAVFDASAATFRLETPGVIAISHSFDGTDYTINNNDGTNGHPIIFGTKAAGQESARIDASGRLLVGTTSNFTRGNLQVIDGGGGEITIGRNDTTVVNGNDLGHIFFASNDANTGAGAYANITCIADGDHTGDSAPTRLVFSTTADGASSTTEHVRIDNAGTTTVWSTSAPMLWGRNETSGTVTGLAYYNTATSTTSLTGNVFRVMCDGDVENTNNAYGAISDANLKENIVDAPSQWDDLKAIQVRKYNFKAETGYNTHTQIGLIAQEVELVSPGLVGEAIDEGTGESTKSVNYSVLYMKAVKALQEAMERIETLEQRLNDAGIS